MKKNKVSSPGSGPGGRSVTVTGGELKFDKYCLICIQPQTLQILLEVDESCPELRKDFQTLIYYLTGSDPNQGRTEDSQECDDDIGAGAGSWMTKVTNLPPMMCPSCHDILGELYRLHRELLRTQWLIQKQTELAREIVAKAGGQPGSSSSRQLFHSKMKFSGIPAEEADAMTKFVEELHGRVVRADSRKQKVIFPSSPPPYFVPEAGSKSTSIHSSSWLPLQLQNGFIRLSRCDRDNVPKLREPVTSKIHSDQEDLDSVGGPGDDDDDIVIPSHSSDPHVGRKSEGDSTSEEDNSDPSYSNPNSAPVRKQKRRSRQGPSEPDDDDEEYAPPPTKKVSKVKVNPAPKTERGPRYSTSWSLVDTEAGTSQHCDLCGELVPSPDIQTHLESQHNVHDFISKCPNPSCPCVFSCEGKLQRHLRHGSSKYTCRRVAKLPDKPKSRKCDSCRFRTLSQPQFREHLQKHERVLMATEKGFQCPLPGCPHGFALKQTLEEHVYSHNPGEKGNRQRRLLKSKHPPSQECDLCGVLITCSEMVAHLEGHSLQLKDYITKCLSPLCPLLFSCVGKMERHLRGQRAIETGGRIVQWKRSRTCRRAANISPGVPTLKCDTCLEMVTGRTAFQNHLQQHELLDPDKHEKSLQCPMPDCDKRYALRQSVEEHLISHDLRPRSSSQDDGLEQECSVCKEMIPIGGISEHLKESHGVIDSDIIPCSNCPLLFHSWESLLDHLYEHRLGSTSFGMACDMCGDDNLKFRRYESLRQHFFNVHNIGRKLSCDECDAEFFSQDRMSHHKERRHSTNESKLITKKATYTYKCDQCPDTFTTKDTLLSHKIKVHGAPPVKCKFCSQEFISVHSCRTHESTHLGLRPTFTCSVEGCGRVFQTRTTWRKHEKGAHLSDTSPKLFVCETCGAGYNLECSFRSHMQAHVKKESPGEVKCHICEICGQSLATAKGLRRHKLIHSGERPFSCHICGQRFRQVGVMRVHLRMHEEKGDNFKPTGAFKHIRKRV